MQKAGISAHNRNMYKDIYGQDEKEFDTALDMAARMVEYGAGIQRAEDTATRLLHHFGFHDISVFAIASFVLLCAEKDGVTYEKSKRVKSGEPNLAQIEKAHEYSRALCSGKAQIRPLPQQTPVYGKIQKSIAVFGGCGAFAIFFGGSLIDACLAGAIVLLCEAMFSRIKPRLNGTADIFIESAFCGFLAIVPALIGIPCSTDKIMIGTIMNFIPGMSIGNAMKDVLLGDTITGLLSMVNGITTAAAIACGYSLSILTVSG